MDIVELIIRKVIIFHFHNFYQSEKFLRAAVLKLIRIENSVAVIKNQAFIDNLNLLAQF